MEKKKIEEELQTLIWAQIASHRPSQNFCRPSSSAERAEYLKHRPTTLPFLFFSDHRIGSPSGGPGSPKLLSRMCVVTGRADLSLARLPLTSHCICAICLSHSGPALAGGPSSSTNSAVRMLAWSRSARSKLISASTVSSSGHRNSFHLDLWLGLRAIKTQASRRREDPGLPWAKEEPSRHPSIHCTSSPVHGEFDYGFSWCDWWAWRAELLTGCLTRHRVAQLLGQPCHDLHLW
jgi:hypothetical protein